LKRKSVFRSRVVPVVSVLIIVMAIGLAAEECTTGLAAPRATANQRALLWKNRDSSFEKNEVTFLRSRSVSYLGIINADDTTQIWAGVNSHGFAIMNAEALDMAVPGEETQYDDEGYLMKTALIWCSTADDFETMLKVTDPIGRKVTSNFGVIDSTGRAAFFEVGNREYFRFDADKVDKTYLIRANFTFNARSSEGYGRHRYARAEEMFGLARINNHLTARYVVENVANDIFLADTLIKRKEIPAGIHKTADTINRFRTVASAVFEGVQPGEDPRLTTFWITLGEPIVSVSIPLWTYAGCVPDLLDGNGDAPLNREFRRLKALVYPDTLNASHLDTQQTLSIRESINSTQAKIFKQTEKKLTAWRKNPPTAIEVADFQKKMAEMAFRAARKIRK